MTKRSRKTTYTGQPIYVGLETIVFVQVRGHSRHFINHIDFLHVPSIYGFTIFNRNRSGKVYLRLVVQEYMHRMPNLCFTTQYSFTLHDRIIVQNREIVRYAPMTPLVTLTKYTHTALWSVCPQWIKHICTDLIGMGVGGFVRTNLRLIDWLQTTHM